jgi:uncharacterized protein (DUF1499 family)
MKAVELRRLDEEYAFHAVFRISGFLDDVLVAVDPDGDGATVTVRSSSRLGRFDLFVNRVRVTRLLYLLRKTLR